MLVGPWSSLMSATTDSGTPPRSPRCPKGTRNCSSNCRSPRAPSSSCTRIGTCRSPASNFASAGPTSPMVATRMVCDRLSVDTPSLAARSARGWIRSSGRSSDVADDVAVDAGDHERDRAQAVFVEEPVADVRHALEVVADLEFELALGDGAFGLRRVIDDQRGAAHLERSRWQPAAIDEHALDFRPLAQARDDFLRGLFGEGEL